MAFMPHVKLYCNMSEGVVYYRGGLQHKMVVSRLLQRNQGLFNTH